MPKNLGRALLSLIWTKSKRRVAFFRVPFPYEGAKTASRVEGGFVLGINSPYKSQERMIEAAFQPPQRFSEHLQYVHLWDVQIFAFDCYQCARLTCWRIIQSTANNIRPNTAEHAYFLAPQVVVVTGLGDPIQFLQHKAPKTVLTAR